MREEIKDLACDFFYWWHNQPGSNTRSGFDDYADTGVGKARINELEAALFQQLRPRLQLNEIERLLNQLVENEQGRAKLRSAINTATNVSYRMGAGEATPPQTQSAEPVAWAAMRGGKICDLTKDEQMGTVGWPAIGGTVVRPLVFANTQSAAVPDADLLAQYIRTMDGNHRMGAGELAESICQWLNEDRNA